MGEQRGPRSEGDHFQDLYSWYELLELLDEASPYEYAFMEQPGAGAADDLTFHPRSGATAAAKFIQIKWHVDYQSVYSFEELIKSPSGEKRSLLEKLFASWGLLKSRGDIELWLVSNWAADPVTLGKYIHARDDRLKDSFFAKNPPRRLAADRASWRQKLGAGEADLDSFCRVLRFQLAFASVDKLGTMIDDRMAKYGLITGENPRAIALDEIGRWLQSGGQKKRVSRDDLLEMVKRRNLRATSPADPPVRLWVHGWVKSAHDEPATIELDWTAHYDKESNRIPDAGVWRDVLFKELAEAKKTIDAIPGGNSIDLRGQLPLSAITVIGWKLPDVGGYSFRVKQPTSGKAALWRSNAGASSLQLVAEERSSDLDGEDLLLVLSLTGNAMPEVKKLLKSIDRPFRAVIEATPPGGPSAQSIASDQDAVAFAVSAKEILKEQRARFGVRRSHLILYAPAGFALFLGQQLNAVGEIVLYEKVSTGGYQEAVVLRS